MLGRIFVFLVLTIAVGQANFFSFSNVANYAKYVYGSNLTRYAVGNELWSGILRDCTKKMSFSCIQKNAYTYLDDAFVERDNITIFDGLIMRKNNLNYETCTNDCHDNTEVEENLVEQSDNVMGRSSNDNNINDDEKIPYEEQKTPLEEVTMALRDKAVKFLSTRDYEIELPKFFFEGSKIKISPREIDDNGALVRIDFGQRAIESEGRLFFKKIRKFIQNRLLVSFLALLLVIKLVKVKFMFIVPFLFGVGTAKKIFLKLLLFLVPAFAHVFKLCSSYYSSHSKSHHHHHHQVAHHHHHVPVPVPVPAFAEHHHPHHHPHHDEEFEGYDYAHPHIQIRKDMEELKEWGIDAFTEPYDDPSLRPVGPQPLPPPPSPLSPPQQYPPNYAIPQYPQIVKPHVMAPPQQFPINAPSHGQALAYSGYLDNNQKIHRRIAVQNISPVVPQVLTNSPTYKHTQSNIVATTQLKSSAPTFPVTNQKRLTPQIVQKNNNIPHPTDVSIGKGTDQIINHEDNFYKPIIDELDSIFIQLRFTEESCRERLVCSMYKNPTVYSPYSNLVSNELSRDPQELKPAPNGSESSKRFYRYVDAAGRGQKGDDCLRIYPCHINTE